MKQFFAIAGLFAVLSVSAQQRPERKLVDPKAKMEMQKDHRFDHKKVKKQRPSAEQRAKHFDQYGISAAQKKKLHDLFESRDREMKKEFERRGKEMAKSKKEHEKRRADFDKKIEKILDKRQYAQYKLDKQKRLDKKDSLKGKRTQSHPRFKG